MGFFDLVDRLANGGPRSRMSPEMIDTYKSVAQATNLQHELACTAAHPSASRAAKNAARKQLAELLGSEKAADRAIQDAYNKITDAFTSKRRR